MQPLFPLLLIILTFGGGFLRFAVADINGDGALEFIAYDGQFLKAFNGEGKLLYKWKYKLSSDIAVADLNGDGREELIFGTDDGRLMAINSKGKVWSVRTGTPVVAKPVISDYVVAVDFRGVLYFIKGGKAVRKMRMLGCCCHVQNQPALGDINGDNEPEIIVATDPGRVFVISRGRVVSNFTLNGFPSRPKVVNGTLYLGTRGLIIAGEKKIELRASEYPLDYGPDGWITNERVIYRGKEVYRGKVKLGVIEPLPVFVAEDGLYIYRDKLVKVDDKDYLIYVRGDRVYALSKVGFRIHVFTPSTSERSYENPNGMPSDGIIVSSLAVILALVLTPLIVVKKLAKRPPDQV